MMNAILKQARILHMQAERIESGKSANFYMRYA